MKNKIFTKIILTTLMCALLTMIVGRVTRVFALAQPIDIIEPIYDTEIIALKDYVEQNLDNPQLDIFFLLGGALAVAQLGAQDAMLESPYSNETSVKEWIINCGIQLYNALIGLVPSGDYYTNIPLVGQPNTAIKGIPRSMIKALVAQMMGNAVVAKNYSSVDDYLNDNDRPDMPLKRDAQISINSIWQLKGGPFHWQFDTKPFTSTPSWTTTNIPAASNYHSYLSNLSEPHIRANRADNDPPVWYNTYISNPFFSTYTNLFLNTSTGYYYFCSDSGQTTSGSLPIAQVAYISGSGWSATQNRIIYSGAYDQTLPTLVQAVQEIYDANFNVIAYYHVFLEDFVKHVYVGTNWIDKQEIFNIQGLNIAEEMDPYYKSPDTDVFFDIKELVENLVNKTSIWDFFLDHLFDIDGNLIIPNFPTFSVDLTPITDLMAPPIPVDLNDFALYTENDYLDEIKDRAENFSSTIGQYFVFWHNADPVTVYVIFGSIIVILLGAFVGKLGHS